MPSMTKAGYTPPQHIKKKPKKKPSAAKKKRSQKNGLGAAGILSLVIFLAACLIGAGVIGVYVMTAPYADAFLPGTMLLGYPLGGASMADAKALLGRITDEDIAGWKAEIVYDTQSYVLSAEDVSLAVDEDATLSPLWQRGREGGMLRRFAEIMRLKSEPMIVQPIVTFDMDAADELLGLVYQDIACEPENAAVTFAPGSAQPFAFSAETIGVNVDLAPTRTAIEAALASVEPVVIPLETESVMPDVTLEELQAALVLRSRVLMEIDGSEAAYANAALAAKALDGAQIEPGEAMSFNETVGERTAERGYLPAPEPAYGEGVSGTGGGVCQVSAALYQAALLGCLDVSERSAAVYPVTYCGMGQEAAVSDQGIDLKLVNPTAYPMFIRARTYREGDRAKIEVQLIGEPLGAKYVLSSGIVEETTAQEPVYVRDHEGKYAKYDDERVEAGEAKSGYRVVVDRVKLDGDGQELAREEISENVYAPVPPAIYIGVEKRESK